MVKENVIKNTKERFKDKKVYLLTVQVLTVSLIIASLSIVMNVFVDNVAYIDGIILYFEDVASQSQFFIGTILSYTLLLIPALNIRRMATESVLNEEKDYLVFVKALHPKELISTIVDQLKVILLFLFVNLVNIGIAIFIYLVHQEQIKLPLDIADVWFLLVYAILLFILITSNFSFVFMKYTKQKGNGIIARLTTTRLTLKSNIISYIALNVRTLIIPIATVAALLSYYNYLMQFELYEFFDKNLGLIMIVGFIVTSSYFLAFNNVLRREFYEVKYKEAKRRENGEEVVQNEGEVFVTPSAEAFFGKKKEEEY